MNNFRANRFIIDKIDKRLVSLEKELKFDRIMILVGIVLAIVPAVLISFTADKAPKLSLLWLILSMFGIVLIITMTKEYISDLKRRK